MRDVNGDVLTTHTVGEVWCFVLADGVNELKVGCGLNNVASTVLKLMGIDVPSQMDEALI
jgi:2,3-bisphosphoglycerate-independent phosphoglycerate mutase